MLKLSFSKLPHYIYSNNRQFLSNEKHMDRTFDESVLILMKKGVLSFVEDGKNVELKEHEYYIQRAGLTQAASKQCESCPSYYFFHFSGTFCEDGSLPIRGYFDYKMIEPIINNISLLGVNATQLEYEMYFYQVLSQLSHGQQNTSDAEKIKHYIISHYREDISLTQLSAIFFRSVNQIINVFKSAYATTPHKYLLNYRLHMAVDLIAHTDRSVKDICYFVGFTDYAVFFRAFTSKFKMSPTDYRNHSRETLRIVTQEEHNNPTPPPVQNPTHCGCDK